MISQLLAGIGRIWLLGFPDEDRVQIYMKTEFRLPKVRNKYGRHNICCVFGLKSAYIFIQTRPDQVKIRFIPDLYQIRPWLEQDVGSRGHFQPNSLDRNSDGALPISICSPFLPKEQKDHLSPPVFP